MKPVFADTYYFLAFLNVDDEAHRRVSALTARFDGAMLTTDWVLIEVADAMSRESDRARFAEFLSFFRSRRNVRIIRASASWFDRGMELYARRRDKSWSLTDCISFVVMERHGLTEALTGDHHFEQAGFKALLK